VNLKCVGVYKHCNTLQYTKDTTQGNARIDRPYFCRRKILQHTAIRWSTQQRTATHGTRPYFCRGNTLQHTATHCNTLQHTATHYNTLQHTATRYTRPLFCRSKLSLSRVLPCTVLLCKFAALFFHCAHGKLVVLLSVFENTLRLFECLAGCVLLLCQFVRKCLVLLLPRFFVALVCYGQ